MKLPVEYNILQVLVDAGRYVINCGGLGEIPASLDEDSKARIAAAIAYVEREQAAFIKGKRDLKVLWDALPDNWHPGHVQSSLRERIPQGWTFVCVIKAPNDHGYIFYMKEANS